MGIVACLLLESGDFLLQEDGGKLALEPFQYIVVADSGMYNVTGESATITVSGVPPTPSIDVLIKLRSFTERRRF
jgi:hypothetical protein